MHWQRYLLQCLF